MMFGFNRYLATDNLYESQLYKGIVLGLTLLAIFTVLYITYCIMRKKLITRITYKREFSDKGSYEGEEKTHK